MYKQWLVLTRVIQLLCTHRSSYETTFFEKEQSIAKLCKLVPYHPYSFTFYKMQNVAVVLYAFSAVTWLKYCRYGVKLYPINQLYAFLIFKHFINPENHRHYRIIYRYRRQSRNLENRPGPRSPKTKCTTCTTFFHNFLKVYCNFSWKTNLDQITSLSMIEKNPYAAWIKIYFL